jgi:hypothetical protein
MFPQVAAVDPGAAGSPRVVGSCVGEPERAENQPASDDERNV